MSDTQWTPATRYRHDADELRRMAGWLEEYPTDYYVRQGTDTSVIALEYFRLADRLTQLADDAREFARTMAGPLP